MEQPSVTLCLKLSTGSLHRHWKDDFVKMLGLCDYFLHEMSLVSVAKAFSWNRSFARPSTNSAQCG
jgi:hypothetical protein